MKWLVQEMLNSPQNVTRIQKALQEIGTEYLFVKIGFEDELVVLDKETKVPYENSEEILQEFVKDEKITVYGSKKIADIAEKMELKPGSFLNENFDFQIVKERIGEHLLNNEFEVGYLWELEPKEDVFFVRPTGNTKLFTGKAISKQEFTEWKENEELKESKFKEQKLMISPIREIQSEYRFFVVEGKIVTASSYQVQGKFNKDEKPSKEMVSFTEKMIKFFPLSKAFVIDIAEADKQYKIVEYNNINCSGLYGCDELKIVESINNIKIEK